MMVLRFEQKDREPAYSVIPADTTPAEELGCFLQELDRNHVDHKETSPGVHEVTLLAGQMWRVQVIDLDDMETQHDLDSMDEAV